MTEQSLSKERHGFTNEENIPWKNTHMELPEGNHIWALSTEQGLTTEACTQLLDLASDSFANTQEEATL